MLLKTAVRSLWSSRSLLLITLLAAWLVAAFVAFGSLFVDTVSEASARRIAGSFRAEMASITLSNPQPFSPEAESIITRELGDMVSESISFSRAYGPPDFPNLGKICGYDYLPGQGLSEYMLAASTRDHCYRVYSFAAVEDLFHLTEGRWPEAITPSDNALSALAPPFIMGEPQIEAVLSRSAAEAAGIKVGDRRVVGDGVENALTVEIVGLVEPSLDPNDIFWHGHTVLLNGEWTGYGDDQRFELGLIVHPDSFNTWVLPRTAPNAYDHRWLRTRPDAVSSGSLKALNERFVRVERDLRANHPQVELVSGLKQIADRFQAELDRFERPVWLLAGAVLALMLLAVAYITRSIFELRRREWELLAGRGASLWQIVAAHAVLIGIAAVSAALAGPLIAWGVLRLLLLRGPLAALPSDLAWSDALARAYPYSILGAALAALLMLLAVSYTARQHTFRHDHPAYAVPERLRFFLDLLLLVVGVAFILRLYFAASGDVGASLRALIESPAALADQIEQQAGDSGLGDPFNVLGPALILGGLALLWLRLLALITRLAAPLLHRARGLALPLAAWQIGRAPAAYTPLAVMLIPVTAIGAAALALDGSHQQHAWTIARRDTGADVRLDFDAAPIDPAWTSLPGVQSGADLMRLSASEQVTLFGVDPARLADTFPALASSLAPLEGQSPVLPGLALPDGTTTVQVHLYSEPAKGLVTRVLLNVELLDGQGVPRSFAMTTADPAITGRFVSYRADLPDDPALGPWRLTGFRLNSEREGTNAFPHTVYLDDVAAVDAGRSITMLADFERPDGAALWGGTASQPDTALDTAHATQHAFSGAGSLQVNYRVRHADVAALQPLLMVNELAIPQIPLVISQGFADWQQRQSRSGQALTVGDTGRVQLDLPVGRFWLAYHVVAIVDAFPTVAAGDRFVIARFEDLRLAINAQGTPGRIYDANQAWLTLDHEQPDAAFRRSAAHLTGTPAALYAWDQVQDIQREPSLKAITGILFAAFWFLLALIVLSAAVYLPVTARQHAPAWAALRAIGSPRGGSRLLAAEHILFIVPTLGFGLLAGMVLVYLLLPFLSAMESHTLALSARVVIEMVLLALLPGLPLILLLPLLRGRG